MEAIVAGTERAHEAEKLSRQYMVESEVHRMLFWRPLRTARMDEKSEGHLNDALRAGRGVLLSSCHTGPIFQTLSVIAARDRGAFCVAAPWFFEQPSHDLWGRRLVRWWQVARARREHVIPSVGSYPLLRLLLEQGELVWLLFDMPGSRETDFLGKRVMVSSSSARLASETGALILPLRSRREGHNTWVDVEAAFDPNAYAGAENLHNALAAVHERWILDLPATLEDPRRRGAWEERATASGWTRPARASTATGSGLAA
jgi:lauroyl/myristoyl acyltransferase